MGIDARSLLRLSRAAGRLLRRLASPAPPPGTAGPSTKRRVPARGGFSYSPRPDGRPDPGEIVWTWVPYEEDPSRGKDRPVLLIGREKGHLLGLALTSRDRNNGRSADARFVDIGTGAWDPQRRPSEVRVDRILRVDPAAIRRNGAVLPRKAFDAVVGRIPRA
ncbi:type II toxin-antitoxin system PemK/MazF family toxin [Arthrobacter sp. TMN-37]